MIHHFRRRVRSTDRRVWLALLGIGLVILVIVSIPVQAGVITTAGLQPTLDAASTQQNIPYPTLVARLTLTPVEVSMSQAAPTLAMEGLTEVHQYAASAKADNSRALVDWSAVQAAGPPNTQTCADARTAWASLTPTGQATLTLLYAQLVVPTHIWVVQSFNPGFIRQIIVRDLYGTEHVVYSAEPGPVHSCPSTLIVDIPRPNYATSIVIILVDQAASTGGWDEIDAVELVGTKYN
jgi:hypothetical protein